MSLIFKYFIKLFRSINHDYFINYIIQPIKILIKKLNFYSQKKNYFSMTVYLFIFNKITIDLLFQQRIIIHKQHIISLLYK